MVFGRCVGVRQERWKVRDTDSKPQAVKRIIKSLKMCTMHVHCNSKQTLMCHHYIDQSKCVILTLINQNVSSSHCSIKTCHHNR